MHTHATKEKRSFVMSRIRSKGTKPELKMRGLLEGNGMDFEMHADLPGTPDFLVGGRVAVFVNGAFWHGYDYMHGRVPRQKYWREKIERNMERDRAVQRKLRYLGFSVLNFWDFDVSRRPSYCLRRITAKVNAGFSRGISMYLYAKNS